MKQYADLIQQTFDWPTAEFKVEDNQLLFHDVPLMDIIREYGTPLKLSYLPKISHNIQRAKQYFAEAIKKHKYDNEYTYCYCTKSSHFSFVIEEALRNDIQLETSSGFDLRIIRKLYERGLVDKSQFVVCNGYKRAVYTQSICDLINEGWDNVIPVCDYLEEMDIYEAKINRPYKMGIRIASDESPNFEFYTSRLGIRYSDVVPFYLNKIKQSPRAQLKMLHFFVNTGIKDSAYYWSELSRFMHTYCDLKKLCPELEIVDIGGGFPIKTSLSFEYDYKYMIDQIVENIKWICDKNNVPVPHIFTEFGSFTVGESGATIYSVADQKLQNDKELWYMIDGSFITHLPDTWGLDQKFILLPINQWNLPYHRVNLGGLTSDARDYYNSETHSSEVFLPRPDVTEDGPLYIGFFHTGAYQESLGGYGGIQHCLIPAPKHVLINRDEKGEIHSKLFAPEQESAGMLHLLGYKQQQEAAPVENSEDQEAEA